MRSTLCKSLIALPIALGCWGQAVAQTTPLDALRQRSSTSHPTEAIRSDSVSQPLTLSIDDAVRIAWDKSSKILIQDAEYIKQTYAEKGQLASLFPSLSLGGSYSYTLKKQKMYFDGFPGASAMPGMEDGIEMGRSHNVQGGLQAAMPLVNFSLWKSLEISSESVALALQQSKNSRWDMALEVQKAYYMALLAQQSLQTIRQSYHNAQTNYRSVQDKFKQGLVAEYDLLRSEVSMSQLEPSLLQAETADRLARKQLLVLIGLDPENPITLSDSFDALLPKLNPETTSQSTASLLENNPTIQLLRKQESLLGQSALLSKYALLPTLSLGFGYNYTFAGNNWEDFKKGKLWSPYSAVTLNFSMPLFSGGKNYYNVRKGQADLLLQQLRNEDTYRQMALALEQQEQVAHTASQKMISSQRAINTAQKGYAIAQKRYDSGLGTQLEINDAQLSLMQAQLQYAQSVYDLLVAHSELEKLRGPQDNAWLNSYPALEERMEDLRRATPFNF